MVRKRIKKRPCWHKVLKQNCLGDNYIMNEQQKANVEVKGNSFGVAGEVSGGTITINNYNIVIDKEILQAILDLLKQK